MPLSPAVTDMASSTPVTVWSVRRSLELSIQEMAGSKYSRALPAGPSLPSLLSVSAKLPDVLHPQGYTGDYSAPKKQDCCVLYFSQSLVLLHLKYL